jgi:predicted nucleotidyltransferase component of viral defense system
MNRPTRQTTAGGAYLGLRRIARETSRPTDELLLRYVLERFLYRVSYSRHADNLVLKGGMLLEVLGIRRPTRDIDLAARGLAEDVDVIGEIVQEIAAVDVDDGVTFEVGKLAIEEVRADGAHRGFRMRIPAGLDRARLVLAVDISFGEAITPRPLRVRYPTLLDTEEFDVLSYPISTVLAEKIETMVRRGAINTRDRDFLDVWLLLRQHPITAGDLWAALVATAKQRGTRLDPLSGALGDLPQRRQPDWIRYLRRIEMTSAAPDTLTEVVATITEFADPVITRSVAQGRWDPATASWIPV